ncbi:FAD binding domain-containing protein [Cubamyces lactineus]|nr:FAD binding domain-containing protein [Cubamyces lactineus]
MQESTVDVLIIGAGPAGLMCANALSRAGVQVRIIDKRASAVRAGHADGIHSRTVEIIQSYGLAQRLVDTSAHLHRAVFYTPGSAGGIERARRMKAFVSPNSRYSFTCTLHQGYIENAFISDMKTRGLEVDRPTIPNSIRLTADTGDGSMNADGAGSHPVKVVLDHLDESQGTSHSETVHAKFVLGADGAHSWVRKAMGIEMKGDVSDHIWGVVDIHPDTDYPDVRNFSVIQSNRGSALLVPRERDLLRLYIQLSHADLINPESGRVDKSLTNPRKIIDMAQEILKPYHMESTGDVEWWTVYAIGQRVAAKYCVDRRVFIAGDACHTHSPKAGQGMNASMLDSHNLAWKLTYVLRGWADMSLLDTYETERRKYAVDLIEFDHKWASIIMEKDGDEKIYEMFERNADFMSGVALRYEPSLIVDDQYQACASKLVVGAYVPPHVFIRAADASPVNFQDMHPADMRFKIIAFVGDIKDAKVAERVQALAKQLDAPDSFLKRYGHGGLESVFDLVCISASSKDDVDYTDFPKVFRKHWSKIYLDDTDMLGRLGGGGFTRFGIDPEAGAIAVVRPDGHVGLIAPCDRVDAVEAYFGGFMRPICTA